MSEDRASTSANKKIKQNFISVREAATVFSYSTAYLTGLARQGKVKARRVGRQWEIEEKSLRKFFKSIEIQKIEQRNKLKKERIFHLNNSNLNPTPEIASSTKEDISIFSFDAFSRAALSTICVIFIFASIYTIGNGVYDLLNGSQELNLSKISAEKKVLDDLDNEYESQVASVFSSNTQALVGKFFDRLVCDIKLFWNRIDSCVAPEVEYAIIPEPARIEPSFVVIPSEVGVVREIIREVIARVIPFDTTGFVSQLAFDNQIDAILRSIENSSDGQGNNTGGGGSGSGSVTSIDLAVPAFLSVSGGPVTSAGVITLSLTSGYEVPLSASTTEWATAYSWGDHSLAGYISNNDNATTSNLTVLGDINTPLNDGCVEVVAGVLTSVGVNCGTGSGGITNLNGLTASSQSFATSTSGGINLFITSTSGVHTFTAGPAAGYSIPLTASTTEWAAAYVSTVALNASSTIWDSITTLVNASSTNWNTAYTLATLLQASSSVWDTTTNIVTTNSSNWTTAYNLATTLNSASSTWNNTSALVTASSSEWSTAYSWGNHSLAGYLTSISTTTVRNMFAAGTGLSYSTTTGTYTNTGVTSLGGLTGDVSTSSLGLISAESDPIFSSSSAATITGTDISNWNNTSALVSASSSQWFTAYTLANLLNSASSTWNTAYSWGDHSLAGYLTSISTTTVRNMFAAGTGLSYSTSTGTFTNTGVTSIGGLTGVVATSSLGLGNGTFLGLFDTPSSYNANRILFTNTAANALTDSANFTYEASSSLMTINGNPAIGYGISLGSSGGLYATEDILSPGNGVNIIGTEHAVLRTGSAYVALSNDGVDSFTNIAGDGVQIYSHFDDITLHSTNNIILTGIGNVGIGTATPSHKFTVAGNTNITGSLGFNGNSGTAGQVLLSTGAGTPVWTSTSSLGLTTAETDPIFSSSTAATITGTNVTNWNTAYSWGDHSLAGYLTSISTTTVRNMFAAGTGLSYSTTTGTYTNTGVLSIGGLTGVVSTSSLGLQIAGNYLVATNNLSDITSSSTARGNLGLGTIATQNANNVSITGGTAIFNSATTTNLTVTGSITTSLTNGCVEVVGGILTSLGTNCGTGSGGITNLNGLTASSQSFATSTSGGINLFITSTSGVHTFTAGPAAGYEIPLSASTTNWNTAYNTVTANSANWNTAYTLANLLNSASSTWNTAYSWGDHSLAGYLTAISTSTVRNMFAAGTGLSYSTTTGTYTNTGVTSLGGLTGVVATSSLGLGNGTFLGLSDTISSYNNNRVLYTNASAVVDSANLTFDGSILSVNNTIRVDSTGDTGFQFYENGASRWTASYSVLGDYFYFRDTQNSQDHLVMYENGNTVFPVAIGNVGIGTSTPSAKLQVQGDFRLTGAFRDSTNATGTAGQILLSTGTSTRWVSTSTLGFLSSYTESDPIFSSSSAATITGTDISNWNNTYNQVSASSSEWFTAYTLANLLNSASSTWNTAYSWGDHSLAGYLTSISTTTVRNMFSNTATGLTYNAGTGETSLTGGYVIPLSASTSEWAAAYASTTALTPAYVRNLFSATSPITYATSTGAIGFNFGTNNTWTGTNTFSTTTIAGLTVTGSTLINQNLTVLGETLFGTSTVFAAGANGAMRVASAHADNYIQVLADYAGQHGLTYRYDATNNRFEIFSDYYAGGSEPYFMLGTYSNRDQIALATSGNVGIGTTTPSSRLTIAGDTNQTGALRFNGNSGTTGQVLLSTGSGAPQWVSTSTLGLLSTAITSLNGQTGSTQTFATGTATGIGLTITSTGNIHTFTPIVSTNYNIPLTASTTNWNTAYNTVTANSANWNTAYTLATILNSASSTWNNTSALVAASSSQWFTAYTLANLLNSASSTWNTAYSWGDHSLAGYLTAISTTTVRGMFSNTATGLTYNAGTGETALAGGYVIPLSASTTQWATAYSWGDHSLAGYLTSISTTTVRNMFAAGTGLSYSTTTGQFANTGVTSIGGLTGDVATSSLGITPSQWLDNGSDIYFNTGRVAVGTSSASALLTVATNSTGPDYGGGASIAGVDWTAQSAAGDDDSWASVTYGNGIFVAVGIDGDRVMTSPDGITWTAQSAADNDDAWNSVTYGNGLFVAVSYDGDRVMTSEDGINWTVQTAADDNDTWNSVTYGNGLFVAVADCVYGGDNCVMTSPDGITWTAQSAADDNDGWISVTYGEPDENPLFVAVSYDGDRVMTSPDGVTWTAQPTAVGDNGYWYSVTYGNGIFVVVGDSGDRVMTSPDGVTWTAQTAADDNDGWTSVTYGNGLFVAVSYNGDRVMTSEDGINWAAQTAAGDDDSWIGVTYGNGLFVAVGYGDDRVMTSRTFNPTLLALFNGGRVGIGTDNPLATLDVNGSFSLSGFSRYINFNTTDYGAGAQGYGIRDNNGLLQFKHANGTWTNFGASTISVDDFSNVFTGTLGALTNANNDTLYRNIAFGDSALQVLSAGDNNVAFGTGALEEFTNGSHNIALGNGAGYNLLSGDNNTLIGRGTWAPNANENGQLNIGNIIFGRGLYDGGFGDIASGNIGIGVVNPNARLTVSGNDGGRGMEVLGQLSLDGNIISLTSNNSIVYAGTNNNTFYTLDASDPSDIQILDSESFDGTVRSLVSYGSIVYAGTYGGSIYTLDVSDPSDIQILDSESLDGSVLSLVSDGSIVYAGTDNNTFYTLDASDPSDIQILDSESLDHWVTSLTSYGSIVYAGAYGGSIYTLDVSDPSDIQMLDSENLGSVVQSLSSNGSTVYAGTNSGMFYVLDASDPSDIQIFSSEMFGGQISSLSYNGNTVYVGTEYGTFYVLDVNDPSDIQILGSESLDSWVFALYSNGSTVYVGTEYGTLYVLDADIQNAYDTRLAFQTLAGEVLFSGFGQDGARYLNFGNTVGDAGYGLRNNGGVMEFKNAGGDWGGFGGPISLDFLNNLFTGSFDALLHNQTGEYNIAFGQDTLLFNDGGSFNVGIGNGALTNNVYGSNNLALGTNALRGGETISGTIYQFEDNGDGGTRVLFSGPDPVEGQAVNISGTTNYDGGWEVYNVNSGTSFEIGAFFAGDDGTGSYQTVVQGSSNIAFGQNALYFNMSGYNNLALGDYALSSNISGYNNLAFGAGSLASQVFGWDNIALGTGAAEFLVRGSNNIAIGNYTNFFDTAGSNQLNLGNLLYGYGDWEYTSTSHLAVGNDYGSYLNFNAQNGAGFGEDGYGFRDNAGTIEFKHEGGAWAALGTGGGGSSAGTEWTARSAAGDNDDWKSVTYGNGTFVAVGGGDDRVMTSEDGITWTVQSAAGNDDGWTSVTYGNGLFVAVSNSGDDRVMTSPDGITWTAQSAVGDNDVWVSVTYGNGTFVAVGYGDDRVMTSPDGITWTVQSAAGDDDSWRSVTYGNGTFVAVGVSSGDDRVMTSPDGITWTAQSVADDDDEWIGVTYGNGTFVAVSYDGDHVITSPDGITWTVQSAAGDDDFWGAITYGNGLFVAVGNGDDYVMTSPDGITWTAHTAAGDDDTWGSVTYGNGVFVAVGNGNDRIMTSGKQHERITPINFAGLGGGSNLSLGTVGQVPFVNGTDDDLDYSSAFTFDGTLLTAPVFNSTGASTTILSLDGATLLTASSTLGLVSLGFNTGTSTGKGVFIGDQAGNNSSDLYAINAIGFQAGMNAVGGNGSNIFGYEAGLDAANINQSNFIGYRVGQNSVMTADSNFIGFEAGVNSINASKVNFIGYSAGYNASNTQYSSFVGSNAGRSSIDVLSSSFVGDDAGVESSNVQLSSFLGYYAGYGAMQTNRSSFIGPWAGQNSSNLDYVNAMGAWAGETAVDGSSSDLIGYYAGYGAQNFSNSSFIGRYAGEDASNISDSSFIGGNTGSDATNIQYAAFSGYYAGANSNNLLNIIASGYFAGQGAVNATSSNFIGDYAGSYSQNTNVSNFIGLDAGRYAENSRYSNFIGYNSGFEAINALDSNFIGYRAGSTAYNVYRSNFIGSDAGYFTGEASYSNFLGYRAGSFATNASSSNFFGRNAGEDATNAARSIFIGNYAGYTDGVNNTGSSASTSIAIGDYSGTGGFSNSIALGQGVRNSAARQLNIGNVLYATGIYASNTSTSTPTADGRFGIGTSTPSSRLTVAGDMYLTGAFKDTTNATGTIGQLLSSTGTSTKWTTITLASLTNDVGFITNIFSSYLDDLADVTAATPSSGDLLSWNGSQWVNRATSTLGLGGSLFTDLGTTTHLTSLTDNLAIGATSSSAKLTVAGTGLFTGTLTAPTFNASGATTTILTLNGSPFISASSTLGSLSIGFNAGSDMASSTQSNFIGYDAGVGAYNAQYSNFIGVEAGYGATNAFDTSFLGYRAGYGAVGASGSSFVGPWAGQNSSNLGYSNIMGAWAGENAVNANGSDLIGYYAGHGAQNLQYSSFIGYYAGVDASNISNSSFFGNSAGYSATGTQLSTFLGYHAGYGSSLISESLFSGGYAGEYSTGFSRTNAFGQGAGTYAVNATSSTFIGEYAGAYAQNIEESTFIGHNSGQNGSNNYEAIFIGRGTGFGASNATSSNFFGTSAGYNTTNASYSNFLGYQAGYDATNAANSIFIGTGAGSNDTVNNTGSIASTSIAIGAYSGTGGFSNSIAFGQGVLNSAARQLNIGNVLYATGIYSSNTSTSTPTADGRFGIGVSNPSSALHVVTNGGDGRLFVDAYSGSTSSATLAGFIARAARGTAQAPQAVQSGDTLFTFSARGYGSTDFSSTRGNLSVFAAENWTDSNQGTFINIGTTPIGSSTTQERMRITAAGNVGIGTPSPSSLLHLAGNGSSATLTIQSTSTSSFSFSDSSAEQANLRKISSSGYGSIINIDTAPLDGTSAGLVRLFRNSSTTGGVTFEIHSGNNTNSVNSRLSGRQDSWLNVLAGNVGIGTTTASSKLTIAGDMFLTGAFKDSANANGTAGMVLISTGTSTRWVATSTLGIGGGGGSLFTDAGATTYLTATGDNLAIGSTTASAKLHITGAAGGSDIFAISSSTGARLLTFTAAGNLGLGTTTPNNRLTVFNTTADAQMVLAYDATRVANFRVDSTGDLLLHSYGNDIRLTDDNLWVCESGTCPSITASSTAGYGIFENGVYFGNGFKIDQIIGTTTELGVYDPSGAVILIFEEE